VQSKGIAQTYVNKKSLMAILNASTALILGDKILHQISPKLRDISGEYRD